MQFIGQARQNGLDCSKELEEASYIKSEIPALEEKISKISHDLQIILESIPNIPSEEVPVALDESGNVEIKKIGDIKS